MHIESRTASLTFKAVIALVGTLTLLQQIGLFSGQFNSNFFCMFTNISNVAVVAYFWCATVAILRGRDASAPWHPKLKYMLMLGITVTFLVAHFLLNGGMVFVDGQFRWPMLVVHYLVPIATILDWILFDEKGHIAKRDPLIWPAFPLCYLACIMIAVLACGVRVRETSRFPYPFLDVDVLGAPAVAGICAGLLVFFIALGFVYYLIDKKMAEKR